MLLEKQHHIAIICSDYAKTKAFYIDKLGFRLIREDLVNGGKFTFFKDPDGLPLELHE